MIFNSVTEIIGKTPLIKLGNIKKELGLVNLSKGKLSKI